LQSAGLEQNKNHNTEGERIQNDPGPVKFTKKRVSLFHRLSTSFREKRFCGEMRFSIAPISHALKTPTIAERKTICQKT
jgi:hypothetical protein